MRISCLLLHCRNTKLNLDELASKNSKSHKYTYRLLRAHTYFHVTSAFTNVPICLTLLHENMTSFVHTAIRITTERENIDLLCVGFSTTNEVVCM